TKNRNLYALLFFAYISISPNVLFMASSSNTQLPFFCVLLFVVILLKDYNGEPLKCIMIGILLGIAALIRQNTLLLLPGVFVFFFESNLNQTGQILRKAALVFAAFAAIVLPWSIRNYFVLGDFVLVATNTGTSMF